MQYHINPDLLVRTGSHLYGCSVPTSDEDTRGFVIPSAEVLLGRISWEQYESKDPDCVIWSVDKFFKLLEKFSPNTVEILFAPRSHILRSSFAGELMIQNRNLFLSKQAVKPMQGFALSEWNKAVNYFEQMRKLGATRKGHIQTYGYSIKNAYHALRLLEECYELLETGNITFPRPNAEYLRKVRCGEIEVEEIKERYQKLDESIPTALANSKLPEKTDKTQIDILYYSIIKDSIKEFYG